MRLRFKRCRIASGINYIQSRKYHKQYLEEKGISDESDQPLKGRRPYIKVFGKLTKISIKEVKKVSNVTTIIWK